MAGIERRKERDDLTMQGLDDLAMQGLDSARTGW